MTQLDVTQITKEGLSPGSFPASMASDFRLFFKPEVHAEILTHAGEDTSFEICGILVGQWENDSNGPYAVISNRIRCDNASSKVAEVTFTHESWAQINDEMDTKYSDLRIIGWYHSHPDFGIFLSDRDVFIQENFFSGAGQVAFVVDPVRKTEGVFEWRGGKPELMSYYWIGDSILTKAASGTDKVAAPRPAREAVHSDAAAGSRMYPDARESSLSVMTTVLGWCCLFLLGYLLAGQRGRWEQNIIREGAAAHYGIWNLLKPGWEDELQEARSDLDSIEGDLKTLSDDHVSLSEGDKKELRNKWLDIRRKVAAAQRTLTGVEARYGLSHEEKQFVALLVAQRITELSGVNDPALPRPDPRLPAPATGGGNRGSSTNSLSKPAPAKSGSAAPSTSKATPTTKAAPTSKPKPAGPELPGSTGSK